MSRNYSNTAVPTTTSGSLSSSATSVAVAALTGYPATPFAGTLALGEADEEVVLVTSVAGTTMTVTRGYGGTTGKAHNPGVSFTHTRIAEDDRDAAQHIDATSSVHGVTGSVVGTSGAQTLSGKTLASAAIPSPSITGTVAGNATYSSPVLATPAVTGGTFSAPTLTAPVIADFTSAQHDHLDADDGGLLTQAATHQSPDTDAGAGSLHHTLGTGANQAAAGNHSHAALDDMLTAWGSYVPTWTATGTNPTLGTGTLTGAYKQAGKLVFVRLKLVVGSSTSRGNGLYSFSLPVTQAGSSDQVLAGFLQYDGNNRHPLTGYLDSGKIFRVAAGEGGNSGFSDSNPITLPSGAVVTFSGVYEAA